MPNIHYQDHSNQTGSRAEKPSQFLLPAGFDGMANGSVAIAWKVNQPADLALLVLQAEDVNQLGPARGLTAEGESPTITDEIECRGFAGIGAASDGNFPRADQGEISGLSSAGEETDSLYPVLQWRRRAGGWLGHWGFGLD